MGDGAARTPLQRAARRPARHRRRRPARARARPARDLRAPGTRRGGRPRSGHGSAHGPPARRARRADLGLRLRGGQARALRARGRRGAGILAAVTGDEPAVPFGDWQYGIYLRGMGMGEAPELPMAWDLLERAAREKLDTGPVGYVWGG